MCPKRLDSKHQSINYLPGILINTNITFLEIESYKFFLCGYTWVIGIYIGLIYSLFIYLFCKVRYIFCNIPFHPERKNRAK